METEKYSILEILEFKNLEQFIVPEIQRDYVWQTTDVIDLLNSLKDGFEGEERERPYLGFIYAYNDREYVYKYFLVDGQQRLTTIFLLLLACHQKNGNQLPEYIIKQRKLKLDYKVRQATHDFLIDLVNHCETGNNSFDFNIKDQVWFHKDYEIDKTINNMVENFNAIREWLEYFDENQSAKFLKFVEDNVDLSYFDIENGRQGEELYIYMNSRGRQLEPNETLKAKFLNLLDTTKDKEKWGIVWEKWQDFFWKQRGSNLDADAGFNDFLKMVQIIHMCELDYSAEKISEHATSKSNVINDFSLFPESLEEIELFFDAYEWLSNSSMINDFFNRYENDETYFASSSRIDLRKKQIYYFRTLPILSFLTKTKVRDERIIIRFIRFFYNVSRKESSIGKDIANNLPNAIKLIIEYSGSKSEGFDVCDLIDYQKGRSVIISAEELIKLLLFKNPPENVTREQIEELFWEAEDHFVFSGEIIFLLKAYINENGIFDLFNFIKTWVVFKNCFSISKENNALISKALLFYGNTWVVYTPEYYNNYNCQDWYTIVRRASGNYLLELLKDMHGKSIDYLDTIIKEKAKEYFIENGLNSIESLKAKEELFEQVKVLVAIDYYNANIIWKEAAYIANNENYTSKTFDDQPFFARDIVIYNVHRYINDGYYGRIIPLMKDVLQNETKLQEVLDKIIA